MLHEIVSFLKDYKAQDALFNICRFMKGKYRWLKPARWSGRLQGPEELPGKCACPGWVSHEPLLRKDKTSAPAEYPEGLVEYAVLVVKTFKQNLHRRYNSRRNKGR